MSNQPSQEYIDHNNWRVSYYNKLVGSFMNHTGLFEHALSNVITDSYCGSDSPEKRALFWTTLLKHQSLRQKNNTVHSIAKIKNYLPEKELKQLNNNFEKIRKRRNLLAHSYLYNTDEEVKKYETHRFKISGTESLNSEILYINIDEQVNIHGLLKETTEDVWNIYKLINPNFKK